MGFHSDLQAPRPAVIAADGNSAEEEFLAGWDISFAIEVKLSQMLEQFSQIKMLLGRPELQISLNILDGVEVAGYFLVVGLVHVGACDLSGEVFYIVDGDQVRVQVEWSFEQIRVH